jgi:hypothetical protein
VGHRVPVRHPGHVSRQRNRRSRCDALKAYTLRVYAESSSCCPSVAMHSAFKTRERGTTGRHAVHTSLQLESSPSSGRQVFLSRMETILRNFCIGACLRLFTVDRSAVGAVTAWTPPSVSSAGLLRPQYSPPGRTLSSSASYLSTGALIGSHVDWACQSESGNTWSWQSQLSTQLTGDFKGGRVTPLRRALHSGAGHLRLSRLRWYASGAAAQLAHKRGSDMTSRSMRELCMCGLLDGFCVD